MSKQKSNTKRLISPFGLTMVVIGACIGSGIFMTPKDVAGFVSSDSLILLSWLIGGGIVLTGALSYSELAGLFPGAGGVYVYLKEAFGKRTAFLYGWSVLTVITSGSVAAIAFVCATYADQLAGGVFGEQGIPFLTIGIILFHTVIHTLGIRIGELFNNFLAIVKVMGIVILVSFGVYFAIDLQLDRGVVTESNVDPTMVSPWIGVGLAMIPILWSFGGFQHATFLAGDSENPKKSVPRAMVIGLTVVTLLYVVVNYTFLSLLGHEALAESDRPAFEAIDKVSATGSFWVAILIVVSTFGSSFIFTMSAPRIYYAMANDGVFFQFFARKHTRFQTPANAIIVQSAWAIILVLFWGTFSALINYVTFLEWVFLGMAGLAVFRFRKKIPKNQYTFRMPLYPILPLVFGLAVIGFLVLTLASGNKPALYAFILLVIGIAVYEIYKRFK
jgi:basic amino acid/polyamine antiporter, APA family